jgi:hypothetical protein
MTDSMSMIERVAKAICERPPSGYSWLTQSPSSKRFYEAIARAAIEAMREPTEAMIALGESYMDFVLPDGFDNTPEGRRAEFKMGFQCAIDAALSEKP